MPSQLAYLFRLNGFGESAFCSAMENVIRIVAALILRADGLALVVRKRGTSAFMQAGGKIEPGETPQAALVRELSEELNLTVSADILIPMGNFEAPAANEPGHKVVADVFRIDIDDREIVAAAEIEEIRWTSPSDPSGIKLAPLTEHELFPALLASAAGTIDR
jgi:8-oxo-dGTP diphosphatase